MSSKPKPQGLDHMYQASKKLQLKVWDTHVSSKQARHAPTQGLDTHVSSEQARHAPPWGLDHLSQAQSTPSQGLDHMYQASKGVHLKVWTYMYQASNKCTSRFGVWTTCTKHEVHPWQPTKVCVCVCVCVCVFSIFLCISLFFFCLLSQIGTKTPHTRLNNLEIK